MGQHHVSTSQMSKVTPLPPVRPRAGGTEEMRALCGKVIPEGACVLTPGHNGRCLPRRHGKHRA